MVPGALMLAQGGAVHSTAAWCGSDEQPVHSMGARCAAQHASLSYYARSRHQTYYLCEVRVLQRGASAVRQQLRPFLGHEGCVCPWPSEWLFG